MHRDYADDRTWSRSAEEVDMWGRDMDHDDWLRGTYGDGDANDRRGPGAWIPRGVRRERWRRPQNTNYGWRSPEYAWPRREERNRHWHGHTPMRGWQRTDERIREDVCGYLSAHPGIDTTDMEVTVSNGEVTLEGIVDDRFEKRMAEDLAEAVAGVQDVHNRLRVAAPGREAGPT